jgi:acetyl-CoA carboxylase biotin carboxyl carrier protein
MKKPKPRQKSAGAPVAAKTDSGLDLAAIRELALIAEEFGLAELEADPSGRVRISRRAAGGGGAAAESAPMSHGSPNISLAPPAPVETATQPGIFITSPFVGTFYRAPSPEASSFCEVGDNVKKGQVVCIVEAMKLMNEIEAEADGKVAEILVKNGEHVEYGQNLIRLSPV